MGGLKRKKKNLKERQETLEKDPSITLTYLTQAVEKYLIDLDKGHGAIIPSTGRTMQFRRYAE